MLIPGDLCDSICNADNGRITDRDPRGQKARRTCGTDCEKRLDLRWQTSSITISINVGRNVFPIYILIINL